MKCFINPRAASPSEPSPPWIRPFLSLSRYREARAEISSWEGYESTPLESLPALSAELGVESIWYKDEGPRFNLGSFKALGGAYAAGRAILRRLQGSAATPPDATLHDLRKRLFAAETASLTLATATDGNHGRAVAWGARMFGARAVIYLHQHVSAAREAAIRELGAEVVRVHGNYDDSVRAAAEDAAANGYLLVPDTVSNEHGENLETAADVMQGYTIMLGEIFDDPRVHPTHVLVQAGVGALAAAVCAHLWEALGPDRPLFLIVESDRADCLYRTAEAGSPVVLDGELDTIMAGLACGKVSDLAWRVLERGANAFLSISDEYATAAVRQLFYPSGHDPQIIAGESGAAGLAGLLAASKHARSQLGLDRSSRVLLIGTESDTDPESFAEIVCQAEPAVVE